MANIIQAEKKDLQEIHRLAHIIWPLVYDYMISHEQIDYMLDKMYAIPALEKQWEEGHHFFLLEHEGQLLGFASCSVEDATKRTRLHKLYIHPSAQGNGWGKLLVNAVQDFASENKSMEVELNVNRHNKSIGFYESIGFKVEASVDVEIGGGFFMNDYVMVLRLTA